MSRDTYPVEAQVVMSGQSQMTKSDIGSGLPAGGGGTRFTWYTSSSTFAGLSWLMRWSGPRNWSVVGSDTAGPAGRKAVGWRVNPACGLASATTDPARKLTTVLLPAPAPPTTATCSGF